MIYITQIIYIHEGQEAVFNEFEAHAIPIIAKYNGQLMIRIRPDSSSIIDSNIAAPYELHVVSFESDEDFNRFMKDEERKKFIHLKQQSIREVIMTKGIRL